LADSKPIEEDCLAGYILHFESRAIYIRHNTLGGHFSNKNIHLNLDLQKERLDSGPHHQCQTIKEEFAIEAQRETEKSVPNREF
jgi:hypothetical protein